MKQEDANKAWEVTVPGSNGFPSITYLCQPKEKVAGLKYPYTCEVSLSKITKLKEKAKELKKLYRDSGRFQQCSIAIDKKAYGFKVHVYLLAYKIGLCGDSSGTTKEEWEKVTKQVKNLICALTGKDEIMYIDPWDDDQKVQARWEKYIKVKC